MAISRVKWRSREPGRVTTCETPSHHTRCAIEAKRGRGAGTSPAAARPVGPSRGPRRRLSESVAKAPIAPECARRIVDIPRFFSPSIPPRDAFVADLDTPPLRAVPGAPRAPLRVHSPRADPRPWVAVPRRRTQPHRIISPCGCGSSPDGDDRHSPRRTRMPTMRSCPPRPHGRRNGPYARHRNGPCARRRRRRPGVRPLRPFTLRCTRKGGVAEGKGA